jgi:uncharacterized NAD-dependent epimerase/dehydratase family protein
MRGVVDYSPNPTVAILDSQRPGESHKGIPVVGTVADALPYEPTTALVGVATQGGRFPPAWRDLLKNSIAAGLDVESGLHEFISEDPELVQLGARHGVELRDLRKPPPDLNVPTGENLKLAAKTVLLWFRLCDRQEAVAAGSTRGTRARPEVAVRPDRPDGRRDRGRGHRDRRGRRRFLIPPTGSLVVEAPRVGEVLFVEGQGSLSHPAYSGVTLGLMHGSAPHAYVLCHVAGATEIEGYPGYPLPPLREIVELHERASLPSRPARVAAIALNTRDLGEDEARAAARDVEEETGLPTDDPVRFGSQKVLDAVLTVLQS